MVSSLATVLIPADPHNYYGSREGYKINRIMVHHMAAVWSAQRCGESFADFDRYASSNYGIGNDGTIGNYVDEKFASGTQGDKAVEQQSVTIEVSNSKIGADYPVSNAALASLVKLVADIAKRNNIGILVPGQTLVWHSMYAATACPGNYLLNKIQYIADEANRINGKAEIDGYSCTYESDRPRGTDKLVLYTKGKSTGTNAFGTECVIDSNGIVVTEPVYGKGNSIIPAGCRVLSGNGIASKWIKDHIKLGYRVWFGDGKANAVVGTFSSISNFNGQRTTNALIVYNSGKTTNTNPYGYEIAVDKSGEAICDPIYGKGHMEIPKGGFVLSGHGSSGGWINSHIHRGDTVLINGNIVSVK